jgi:predicted TIM-barrel fold metal-dependent hydrolase
MRMKVRAISWRNAVPTEEALNAFYGYPEPTAVGRGYAKAVKVSPKPRPVEEWAAELREAGIVAIISAIDNEIPHGKGHRMRPESIAELIERFPGQFIGFAGANPHKGMEAVREFERQIKTFGFKGLDLQPMHYGIGMSDARYYPLLAKAVELDVPVFVAVSAHYNLEVPMDVQHPVHVDRVCTFFPELKVVARHAGWPWVEELAATAFRHQNVYFEISGIRARYLSKTLLDYIGGAFKNRTVYGSPGGVGGITELQALDEFCALPLKEEVKQKILIENSVKLLGLQL